MKIIIKNIVKISVVSLFLASCADLNQYPHDTLANEDSFKTITDARFWTNGMYEDLRASTYGIYMNTSEIQTDLLDARRDTQGGNVYRWEEFTASEPSTQNIWQRYYHNIAQINNILEGFGQIQLKNQAEKQELVSYTGALYLARALYYSRLVTLFCKAYDPATATSDLGLPLLVKLSVKDFPQRSSLEATYDFILSDIEKAQNMLLEVANEQGSQVFTSDAALLLKSRILLYKKQWKDALEIASEMIESGRYPLVSSQDDLELMWYYDSPTESIVQLYASNSEPISEDGRNTIYIGYRVYGTYEVYTPEFIPNQWIIDLYENQDIRKSVYFAQRPLILEVDPYTQKDFYLVYKFPGNPNLKTAKISRNEHAPKIFRIAEAYLIAAEAAYMNSNEAIAKLYLNDLRVSRQASEITLTGMALLQEIKEERVRELSFEGFRLMDLKRWGQGVDRLSKQPQDFDFIVTTPADQFHMLQKNPNDYRMVWPIPSVEILEFKDKKLKQNEGW